MEQILYPILGISLIFLCTTIGSLFVFFLGKKEISPRLNKIFTGFAAGVMFSASFFSLIKPALETNLTYMPSWLVVVISILLGALFLWGIDKLVPHFHVSENQEEGLPSKRMSKTSKMFLAVTIHNIPEGLSVGIAFGVALSQGNNLSSLTGALLLAIGIGIQNINQKLLSSLPIPVPPIGMQKKYAAQVEAIEKQKELIRQQLADAETLMKERMQYYFS